MSDRVLVPCHYGPSQLWEHARVRTQPLKVSSQSIGPMSRPLLAVLVLNAVQLEVPDRPLAGNPRPGESGPRFPFPAESGIGDSLFPGQIGNRGFPPRFPGPPAKNRESGDPIPDSRFPSDVRASLATAVDSEYTQPRVSCQCSHRQHAAPIQGLREGTCSCPSHLPP